MRGFASRTAKFLPAALVALVVAALPGSVPAWAAPQAPAGYVTDKAGILNSGDAAATSSSLQGFDQQTGNQVVVWIDNTLPAGQTVESFAQDAFNSWGIGQKDHNNGVLFVVFVRSHLTRIQVGTGLTGLLSDALAANIINGQVLPRFRAGDYSGGVSAALTGITGAIKGTAAAPIFPVSVPGPTTALHHGNAGVFALVGSLGLFLLVVLGSVVGRGRRRGPGWGSGWGGSPYYYNNAGYYAGGFRSSNFVAGSGSAGGSGFSGGGFSGGGGSTGGGGATGSW